MTKFHAKLFEVKRFYSLDIECVTPAEAEAAIRLFHKKGELKAEEAAPGDFVVMVGEPVAEEKTEAQATVGWKRPPKGKESTN